MSNRIVLLPFPEAASFNHLASTRGGASQQLETGYSKATAAYQSMVNTLKNAQVPQTSNLWANLDAGYKQAGLDYARGKKPGWKKIDPQDVVCSDSLLLTAALQKLQAADDTLYIRGHCAAGSDTLHSSDRKQAINVDDLVNILDGKLDKKFPGKVKIYGCESSKDTVSASFAKKFAIALSQRGWINCTFYGYNETLKTFIEDVNGHKWTQRGTRSSASRQLIQVPTKHTEGCIIS